MIEIATKFADGHSMAFARDSFQGRLIPVNSVDGATGSEQGGESQREQSLATSEIAPDLWLRPLNAWCEKERGCLLDGHVRSASA